MNKHFLQKLLCFLLLKVPPFNILDTLFKCPEVFGKNYNHLFLSASRQSPNVSHGILFFLKKSFNSFYICNRFCHFNVKCLVNG